MSSRSLNIMVGAVILLLCLHPAQGENGAAPPASEGGLYDADPNHLWNRLHRALFVRTAADGAEYGFDQLDPLLWVHTTNLLAGLSHQNAIKVLDEFLASHGEKLVGDPLKRAILQRDLWVVFDWTAIRWSDRDSRSEARQALRTRLARIIPRLALTKEQIDALPDNYAGAAQSHQFEEDYNDNKPNAPFLPAALLSGTGPWICVGLTGEQRIAPMHVSQFGGRSAFLVFMRTPGGFKEGTNYLKQFREFPQPYVYETSTVSGDYIEARPNPDLPQFPAGTTFVLVRQMLLVDQDGELVPTHLTESVQLRRYNDVHSQRMFEFRLSRKQLFAGVAGGLLAVAPDEKEFRQFMDKGFDPFERIPALTHKPVALWLHPAFDCTECHGGTGLFSVNSFLQRMQTPTVTLPYVMLVDSQQQRDAARYWKQTQFNWGLLKGLWERD